MMDLPITRRLSEVTKHPLNGRRGAPAKRFWRFLPTFEFLEERRVPALFTVTNTADAGPGSLRQAILDANTAPGSDTVAFNIGTGVQTIRPDSPLPALAGPTIIDGFSQPGGSGPKIELDGSRAGASADGLTITAGGCTVQGLVINRFGRYGVLVTGGAATGNRIQGNFIGIDAGGGGTFGFQPVGVRIQAGASTNTVGGTTPAARNVISGNVRGVWIVGQGTNDNQVLGNFIGTNASGRFGLRNSHAGVAVEDGAAHTWIGGPTAGARNVISGNDHGVVVVTPGVTIVQGNFIGTDVTGDWGLGNQFHGIWVGGSNILIGGAESGSGNVIAASGREGIWAGGDFTGLVIQGNRIGTNAAGTFALGNGGGIHLAIGAHGNLIGGAVPGAGNLLSGNRGSGLWLSAAYGTPSHDNVVQGNVIGLNAAGDSPLPNDVGLDIWDSPNNRIGGVPGGATNVVSGNRSSGISITGAAATGNLLFGNLVGTNAAGASLPNGTDGIQLTNSASANMLVANTIAHNLRNGIRHTGGPANQFQANSIHSNGGLGTDLGGNGVTPNDYLDADAGANGLQNYPDLIVAAAGDTTIVVGLFHGQPETTFIVELFASAAADPSGHGEGERYLGAAEVTTDSEGNGVLVAVLDAFTTAGEFISATATDALGNTSEFSAAILAQAFFGPGDSLLGRIPRPLDGGAANLLRTAAMRTLLAPLSWEGQTVPGDHAARLFASSQVLANFTGDRLVDDKPAQTLLGTDGKQSQLSTHKQFSELGGNDVSTNLVE